MLIRYANRGCFISSRILTYELARVVESVSNSKQFNNEVNIMTEAWHMTWTLLYYPLFTATTVIWRINKVRAHCTRFSSWSYTRRQPHHLSLSLVLTTASPCSGRALSACAAAAGQRAQGPVLRILKEGKRRYYYSTTQREYATKFSMGRTSAKSARKKRGVNGSSFYTPLSLVS